MAATDTGTVRTADDAPRIDPDGQRVIWLLLAATFVAILNETTMTIAIPHLISDLGITELDAQWLTTAFMLTMAVVIPVSGFLLQRFTTRTMFIAAMSLFSFGTLLAVVAPGYPFLVAARVVQASGTAIMMPLLMTTLMSVVPPQLRGRMMGRVSIVISLAPAIGPTMAGILLDTLGWRWIFGIVLPIAVIALVVGAKWIRNLGEQTDAPIDAISVILSAAGFGGLVYGLSQIGAAAHGGDGSSSGIVLAGAFVVGAVGIAAFVWRQLLLQRADRALLDLRVFRSGNFTVSIVQMALLSAAFFGSLTVLPLFLQRSLELSSTETGLIVLPGALAMGLSGPMVGRIYDRWGTRALLVTGALLVAGSLAALTTLNLGTPIWLVVIVQTALSLGLALSFTPLFSASLGSLEPHFYSYGSAVLSTIQQVAGAAGTAVLVTTLSAVSETALTTGAAVADATAAGTRSAFLIAAMIAVPAVVLAFFVRKPADDVSGAPVH